MARIINQETFNQAVQENKEMFDLSTEDAVNETVDQFEKQGVDLSNIIKDMSIMGDNTDLEAHLRETMTKFADMVKTSGTANELCEILDIIHNNCDKSIAHRLFIGKMEGYSLLIDLLNKYITEIQVEEKLLITITALMSGQPDLLESNGIETMKKLLTQSDNSLRVLTLIWIKTCCIKHEHNRQNIFKSDILQYLTNMLKDPSSSDVKVIRQACAVCRALVLDDDIRVEFGNAHDHAKAIASELIRPLLDKLKAFKTDETVVSDLMLTLAALLVRAEFCKILQDAGGVEFVLEALVTFAGRENVVKQGLKLIKALAGNDDCKMYIVSKGGATPMAALLDHYKKNMQITHANLAAMAALALRAPENSDALYKAGVPDTIIECMRLHSTEWKVQKAASWVIRNMVSRNKEQCKYFVSIGAEIELNKALQIHGKQCEYDIKSALRDLGCQVVLKEEWTGKGGKIFTEESVSNFESRYD